MTLPGGTPPTGSYIYSLTTSTYPISTYGSAYEDILAKYCYKEYKQPNKQKCTLIPRRSRNVLGWQDAKTGQSGVFRFLRLIGLLGSGFAGETVGESRTPAIDGSVYGRRSLI